jgi:hypothetical protein
MAHTLITSDVRVDPQIPSESLRLAKELFEIVQEKFPEVTLLAFHQSPEYHDDVWMYVRLPDDEQLASAFSSCTAELSIDCLVEHGFQVIVLPHEPVWFGH